MSVAVSSDHSSRIVPPPAVLEIVHTLQRAGYETWCVGGAVRDALLGHILLDWDLATAATPPQVRRLFARTIPVGIEFGTVGVLDASGHMHEVTTFRHDVQHDGRHAVVQFGASLDEDLARRDFTINAIAFDPVAGVLRDPFGGQADLAAQLVRAVGEPDERMREDRLRALRAIRFAARFGFALEPETWRAIVASAPHLTRLSPERVKQEIDKTMEQVRAPSTAFIRWRDSGAFAALIPSLATVSDEVLSSIDALPLPGMSTRPQRRILRVAALLSDQNGSESVRVLKALRFSNHEMAWISALVDLWHQHGSSVTDRLLTPSVDHSEADKSSHAVRRLASVIGRLRVGAFVRLAAARWSAARNAGRPAPTLAQVRALHRALLHSAFHDALDVGDLAIDGDDVRRAGVAPGPQIGRVLQRLLDDVLDDPSCNTRDALSARATAYASALR